jgi:hypothetical protein
MLAAARAERDAALAQVAERDRALQAAARELAAREAALAAQAALAAERLAALNQPHMQVAADMHERLKLVELRDAERAAAEAEASADAEARGEAPPGAARSRLRVVSLNILAPELLCYFWRSSYGLPLLPDARDYLGALTRRRMQCLALALRALVPPADVVCLQETGGDGTEASGGSGGGGGLESLDGLSTQAFLARELGLVIASQSCKDSEMRFGLPPAEQAVREEAWRAAGARSVRTGVATLYNPRTVRHAARVAAASTVALSPEARAAYPLPGAEFAGSKGKPCRLDSPHVADEFVPRGSGGGGGALGESVVVVNFHAKMQPAHSVRLACAELFARLGAGEGFGVASFVAPAALCPEFAELNGRCPRGGACALRHGALSAAQWQRALLVGDFNAGGRQAHAELAAAVREAGAAIALRAAAAGTPLGEAPGAAEAVAAAAAAAAAQAAEDGLPAASPPPPPLRDATPLAAALAEDPREQALAHAEALAAEEAAGRREGVRPRAGGLGVPPRRRPCKAGDECAAKDCAQQHLRTNDRVLLGARVRLVPNDLAFTDHERTGAFCVLALPQLEGLEPPFGCSASDPAAWGTGDAAKEYPRSARNAALLAAGRIATDHPLMVVDVAVVASPSAPA